MKTRLQITMVVLLSIASACQKVILFSKGIRNPTIKSETDIREFLRERKIPSYDGSFVVRDSISFINLVKKVKTFPGVAFFSPFGEHILINDSTYCAGVAHTFSMNLQSESSYPVDSSFLLEELTGLVRSLESDHNLLEEEGAIVVMGFWATYFGSVNENVFGVLEAASRNPNVKTRIYLVNIDFLESWGLKTKLNYKIN
ncbi:MAG: hypothetical protein ISR57_07440 [Bacteroidales bacterium]|nr:hypothetical protein [Bacteroidota bacterium]MBL6950462.1 hypothetical protein [Bacteroidales bacterium]